NASDSPLTGELSFEIQNPENEKSVIADFGLTAKDTKKSFTAPKNGAATLTFQIKTPKRVGTYAFKVTARAKNFSDGERRPFPVLPSRMHLAQSRFTVLKNKSVKTLEFKDLADSKDKSLINEKMIVTVDAQLFYGVLQSLPYLVNYPYECTEQTLNRFLATGIVSSILDKYPAVERMAEKMSARKTQLESFDDADPNRRMTLEESPWLLQAKGGAQEELVSNVLQKKTREAVRSSSLEKLRKMQLDSGAFPWFKGGPPDAYITLYILYGFSKALEFKVEVPKDMIVSGWRYLKTVFRDDIQKWMKDGCCWEYVTFFNYVLSNYPDLSWTGGAFTEADRREMLDYSFKQWRSHSPYLKGYLALTLHRMGRKDDAVKVWESVMDSSKTDELEGTHWAREERSWLWYNDTVETHAFALRTMLELMPKDKRTEGLVQWLFLNKKLNHWSSTKATAEAIYSLTHYLDQNAELGTRESVTVNVANQETKFSFEPDTYTGKKNQIVIDGPRVDPKTASKITVAKDGPGMAFASATWHFSTEELPKASRGDFFAVERAYFKRVRQGSEYVLKPLTAGEKLAVGDQVEVHVSLKTKHEAEYVHLRDPRASGLEPETQTSGYKWDLGIFWYEETRDSGSNFFFSRLPVGEYTFKYRLRANMAGNFRVAPATVQSMYAPEFNAYSAGHVLTIKP
ncbi:MAG TPA: hypothetical protein VFV50_06435, partial [Bdellovibrionales bacterium]|nr:hypothetical protein [Bdellovibrionales bacterium]